VWPLEGREGRGLDKEKAELREEKASLSEE
jgi:hypothetical protein